jgi:hypothetical protein
MQRRTSVRLVSMPLVVALVLAMTAGATARDDARPIGAAEVPALLPTTDELERTVVDPALRSIVDQLDAPSYRERESALDALSAQVVDIAQLCALLDGDDLSTEQRYRLLTALREQLVNKPAGALGINMIAVQDLRATPGAQEVTNLVPNLPAIEVLEVGDRITHVDGLELQTNRHLRNLVQSKRPGDEITLGVQRPERDETGHFLRDADDRVRYRRLEVTLRLGSLAELRAESGGIRIDSAVLRQRDREALLAEARWAPRPEILLAAGESPPEGDWSSLHARDVIAAHVQIVRLKREIEEARRTGLEPDEDRVSQWRATIAALKDFLAHPDLGRLERRQLEKQLDEAAAAAALLN